MVTLGHESQAVHRHYAHRGDKEIPDGRCGPPVISVRPECESRHRFLCGTGGSAKTKAMAARRKQDSIVDDLHELFLHVPAWLCIPAALIAFAGVKMMLASLAAKNVMFTGLAQNGSVFGGNGGPPRPGYRRHGGIEKVGAQEALRSANRIRFDSGALLERIRASDR